MIKTKREMERVGKFLNVLDTQVIYSAFTASYYANKLHIYLSGAMVWFTTLALIFIIEEKALMFQFPKVGGYDIGYSGAVLVALIFGYFLADYAEKAKIAQLRNFIFSSGWNVLISFFVGAGVMILLIYINMNGVEKGANFSYRYMNDTLMESVEVGLDKEGLDILKANSHAIAKQGDFTLERETIRQLQEHRKTIIANPTDYTKRNLSVQDWKIKQAINTLSQKQTNQSALMGDITTIRLETLGSLRNKISTGKAENLQTVNGKKEWAIMIAVWGEIIDAFFILAYLFLHKTNPSLDTMPTPIKGRREDVIQSDFLKVNAFSQKHLQPTKTKSTTSPKTKKLFINEGDEISDEEIYKLNIEYGKEIGNFIGDYLKQPPQAKFTKWLKEVKKKPIHTTRLSRYNANYQGNGKLQALRNNQGYIMIGIKQEVNA